MDHSVVHLKVETRSSLRAHLFICTPPSLSRHPPTPTRSCTEQIRDMTHTSTLDDFEMLKTASWQGRNSVQVDLLFRGVWLHLSSYLPRPFPPCRRAAPYFRTASGSRRGLSVSCCTLNTLVTATLFHSAWGVSNANGVSCWTGAANSRLYIEL